MQFNQLLVSIAITAFASLATSMLLEVQENELEKVILRVMAVFDQFIEQGHLLDFSLTGGKFTYYKKMVLARSNLIGSW